MAEHSPGGAPEFGAPHYEQMDETVEAHRPRREQAETPAEASHESKANDLEEIRHSIEQAAEAQPAVKATTEKAPPKPAPTHVNKELHQAARDRALNNIQRKLPLPQRTFSKFIHTSTIKNVSAASAATVTRPSGMLGGSIFAFLGSLLFYWLSKRTGFSYNYLLFILFFVGGFVVGLVLELSLFLVRHKKPDASS